MKKFLHAVIVICFSFFLLTSAFAAGQNFSDVPKGQWYSSWVT